MTDGRESPPDASELVELVESEVVTGRGRRVTTFLVRLNDAWVPAREHPSARVEPIEAGPGTVWERRIELQLARGARLVRVVSEPLPEPRHDPLDYLTGAARKARRRTVRTELSVGARGRLDRV